MKTIIEEFYQAFANLDSARMVDCYHPDVKFEDPAFGLLKGDKAKNMWRMLCDSQKDKNFKIDISGIEYDEGTGVGKAHWEAYYLFSKTGRKVHNIIDAEFRFKEGKIIEHIDRFDIYRWSRQALGLPGYLIGWTSYFKKKLNLQTKALLSKYERSASGSSQ